MYKNIFLFLLFIFNYCLATFESELIKRKEMIAKGLPQVPLDSLTRDHSVINDKFVSGDYFRYLSDHVLDETDKVFEVTKVKQGDVVFVSGEFVDLFFKYVHAEINCKYVLITHNSDLSFPANYRCFLDHDKIIAWYTVNPDIEHEKLIPIPIGFANHHWPMGNLKTLEYVTNVKELERVHLCIMNFRTSTNFLERNHVYEKFKCSAFCYKPPLNLSFEDYLLDLKKSKFCLSPFGNGKDCHRVWEAVLMGCVPIVKSSNLNSLYKNNPIMIIENWDIINENFLKKEYKTIKLKVNSCNILSVDYWKHDIDKRKCLLI